jgi:hypothetical protein
MKMTRLQLSYKPHTDFRSGVWQVFKVHFERVGYECSARFSHVAMPRVPAYEVKKSFGGCAIPKGLFLEEVTFLPLPATSLRLC